MVELLTQACPHNRHMLGLLTEACPHSVSHKNTPIWGPEATPQPGVVRGAGTPLTARRVGA